MLYFQLVPQIPYGNTRPYDLMPAIMFEENGFAGVYLGHALRHEFDGLRDADSIPTLSMTARKVTLRVNVRLRQFR
jgi:hypothetical protein